MSGRHRGRPPKTGAPSRSTSQPKSALKHPRVEQIQSELDHQPKRKRTTADEANDEAFSTEGSDGNNSEVEVTVGSEDYESVESDQNQETPGSLSRSFVWDFMDITFDADGKQKFAKCRHPSCKDKPG